ncbi:MAG: renalase [Pseudohongiellaceae bacterium]|jgi:predicted NAD/FAD-dependent oxidoreductase
MKSKPKSIAIIGAGLAGVTAARELATDFDVQLFEKSRGAGGRMSSRRVEPFSFNHGAQFFTARSTEFNALVTSAKDHGIVAQWSPRLITLDPMAAPFKREWFEPHYVASAGMNGLAKYLAGNLNLSLECQIDEVIRTSSTWILKDSNGGQHGPFDWVIAAAPAAQTYAILPASFRYRDELEQVRFSPCFALMLGYSGSVDFGFEAAVIKNSPLAWAVAHKDQHHSTLLLHSDNLWATEHLEHDLAWVQQTLLSEMNQVLPQPLSIPEHIQLHRWRFARCESPLKHRYLLDSDNGLGVCGDWCGGNRVEDAFTSAMSLAAALKTLPS